MAPDYHSSTMGPISYLLHLLQTNSGPPQLPQFRTIQACSKDVPIAPW